jgi:hypothetical protein
MKKTNTVIHIDADKFYNMVWDGFMNFQDFILEKGGANLTVEEAYNELLKAYESKTLFGKLFCRKLKTLEEYSKDYSPSKNYKDYLNRYEHFYDTDQRFLRLERVTSSVIKNNVVIDVSISDYDFVLNWIDNSDDFNVQYNSWIY